MDPELIISNTDTVNVFLALLRDACQLADTTVTVETGNTDPIVFVGENGDPFGITLDFGTLSGDGWAWPEAEFAAKSLSVVTSVENDAEFDIGLENPGDYPLSYTTEVKASLGLYNWLSAPASG